MFHGNKTLLTSATLLQLRMVTSLMVVTVLTVFTAAQVPSLECHIRVLATVLKMLGLLEKIS